MPEEPRGGDPPCRSHLFEEEIGPSEVGTGPGRGVPAPAAADADAAEAVDLVAIARSAVRRGPAWTRRSEDLDANLLVFRAGEGVAEHANEEVDVLLVGVAGEGVVTIDGRPCPFRAGQAVLVPKGARRGTRAVGDGFAYLTCHRRRAGFRPRRATPATR